MSGFTRYNENWTDGDDQSAQSLEQAFTDSLGRFLKGRPFNIFDCLLNMAPPFFSNMLAEKPAFGQFCVFIFTVVLAMWKVWQSLPRLVDQYFQCLKSRALAFIKIEQRDDDLWESAQAYALAQSVFGSARHVTAKSATFARNTTRKVISEKESVIIECSHTTQFFRYKARVFMLTQELNGDNIKIWTYSRTVEPIHDMLRDVYFEQAREKSLHEIKVFCAETVRSYNSHSIEWVKQPRTDRRTMKSVCLPTEIKTKLIKSIERFLHPGAPA